MTTEEAGRQRRQGGQQATPDPFVEVQWWILPVYRTMVNMLQRLSRPQEYLNAVDTLDELCKAIATEREQAIKDALATARAEVRAEVQAIWDEGGSEEGVAEGIDDWLRFPTHPRRNPQ